MINLEPLDDAIGFIEANPRLHKQATWLALEDCGTVGCLAGWIAMRNGWQPVGRTGSSTSTVHNGRRMEWVPEAASKILAGPDPSEQDMDLIDDMFDGDQTLEGIKKIRDRIADDQALQAMP